MAVQPISVAPESIAAYTDIAAKLASVAGMARSIGQRKIECTMMVMFNVMEDITHESTMTFTIDVLSETGQEVTHLSRCTFEHTTAQNSGTKRSEHFTWCWNASKWNAFYDAHVRAGATDARPTPMRADDDPAGRKAHDEERLVAIDADLAAFICTWRDGFAGVASDATVQQKGWTYNFEPHLSWSIRC